MWIQKDKENVWFKILFSLDLYQYISGNIRSYFLRNFRNNISSVLIRHMHVFLWNFM